jgi:hypothetical protein
MPTHISFPSISQFRNVIRTVKERCAFHDVALPKLTFRGTVKIHGTNAAICIDSKGTIWAQSRENIINVEQDNAGFAKWVETVKDRIAKSDAFRAYDNEVLVIYGEWCGPGIQKGVAVNQLKEKTFVVFDACVYDTKTQERHWIRNIRVLAHELGVPCSHDFLTWVKEIDFANPEDSQNFLVSITEGVEKNCPVAWKLTDAEVAGVGEGVVWTIDLVHSEPGLTENQKKILHNAHSDFRFKVKGEKHSASKVTKLAAVDIERMNSIKELAATFLTESRLNQGFERMKDELGLKRTPENTGVFVKWVAQDVWKEEKDTIEGNGFTAKEVMAIVSKRAAQWYLEKCA